MNTGYKTSTGVDIVTLFESGTSATPTGYLLSGGGGDLNTIFASGNSTIKTGYLLNSGQDIGTLFSALPVPLTSVTTWTNVTSSITMSWGMISRDNCIACNRDGNYALCVANHNIPSTIYLTSNGGTSWSRIDNANIGLTSSIRYYGLTISDTGQYMYVSDKNGIIKKSINYGVSWTVSRNFVQDTSILSCDGTGQYVLSNGTPTGYAYNSVWYSSDYGSTWTSQNSTFLNVVAVHISNNALYWVIGQNNGYVYMSTNYGVSWTLIYSTPTLTSQTVKATNDGVIYRTTETSNVYKYSGGSWTTVSPVNAGSKCSINKDGTIIHIGANPTSYASVNSGSSFSSQPISNGGSCVSSSGNCIYNVSSTNIFKCIG